MPNRYNWMADTGEEAFQALIEIQRNIPPGDKLAHVLEMADMAIRMARDRIRREHPGADEREVFLREVAERLGHDTAHKAYGWDPGIGACR